ncbi:MAG: hypothetical protein NTV80_15805 [Verrucomicrobia bacterium]|nr:hypothetical protein [Verrucomicrobiota bacterium]
MTKTFGPVNITTTSPEVFVADCLELARKNGIKPPSVIWRKMAFAQPLTYEKEKASLRELLKYAAVWSDLEYHEYAGIVILGDHKHPLLTKFYENLEHVPSLKVDDPFQ